MIRVATRATFTVCASGDRLVRQRIKDRQELNRQSFDVNKLIFELVTARRRELVNRREDRKCVSRRFYLNEDVYVRRIEWFKGSK